MGANSCCGAAPLIHGPLSFVIGDTWPITGQLSYADGTPFNLNAGCAIEWLLQDAAGDIVMDLSLAAGGITVLDPNAGTCLITVTPSQSGGLVVGAYTDQLRATDPAGLVSTQWQGTINARQSLMAGVGAGNFAVSQVTVSSAAVLLIPARAGRLSVTVSNFGNAPIYVGPTNGVTPSTGQVVGGQLGGQSQSFPTQSAIYAIAGPGVAQQVSVTEFY